MCHRSQRCSLTESRESIDRATRLHKSSSWQRGGGPVVGRGGARNNILARNIIVTVEVRRSYRWLLEFVEGSLRYWVIVGLVCVLEWAYWPKVSSAVSLLSFSALSLSWVLACLIGVGAFSCCEQWRVCKIRGIHDCFSLGPILALLDGITHRWLRECHLKCAIWIISLPLLLSIEAARLLSTATLILLPGVLLALVLFTGILSIEHPDLNLLDAGLLDAILCSRPGNSLHPLIINHVAILCVWHKSPKSVKILLSDWSEILVQKLIFSQYLSIFLKKPLVFAKKLLIFRTHLPILKIFSINLPNLLSQLT